MGPLDMTVPQGRAGALTQLTSYTGFELLEPPSWQDVARMGRWRVGALVRGCGGGGGGFAGRRAGQGSEGWGMRWSCWRCGTVWGWARSGRRSRAPGSVPVQRRRAGGQLDAGRRRCDAAGAMAGSAWSCGRWPCPTTSGSGAARCPPRTTTWPGAPLSRRAPRPRPLPGTSLAEAASTGRSWRRLLDFMFRIDVTNGVGAEVLAEQRSAMSPPGSHAGRAGGWQAGTGG